MSVIIVHTLNTYVVRVLYNVYSVQYTLYTVYIVNCILYTLYSISMMYYIIKQYDAGDNG